MADTPQIHRIRTVCPAHCGIDACGILAHVRDGRVVKVEPGDFPDPRDRRICLRGLVSTEITYHPDRLKTPLRRVGNRGEGKFEPVSWEEALDTVAKKFQDIARRYGWPAVAWVLGGPGAGTTKFGAYLRLASLTRSTRVSAWGYGDAGLPCGSRVLFGSQFPWPTLMGSFMAGRLHPDLLVVWGANPGESQPLNLMRRIMDAKERGARLVVIDPRFTVTASKADAYLGLRPGTDTALALALLHVIFREGLEDEDFLHRHTVGPYLVRDDNGKFLRGRDLGAEKAEEYAVWDLSAGEAVPRGSNPARGALRGNYSVNGIPCRPAFQCLVDLCQTYPPGRASEITGIPAAKVEQLARRIGTSARTVFITHMGLSRTYHGDVSLRALGTVAAVTGNLDATFSGGPIPPVLNWRPFLHADPEKPSYKRLGILQLYEAVRSGKPYPVRAVWFSFINFLNQCANTGKIEKEILPALEFIVDVDLFMTPTARWADIVLPACSYLEFSDLIPHPFPYVQVQQKVIEPLHECRSDVDIAAGLAERLGFADFFQGGEEGFIDMILDSGHDSIRGITRQRLQEEGAIRVNSVPDLSEPVDLPFSTASGKIEIYSERLLEDGEALPVYSPPLETPVEAMVKKYPLAFIQGHSRFRTHSMFANVDKLLELNPRPLVEIHPEDAAPRGICDGDLVTVYNDRGRATLCARLTQGITPGTVNINQGWWIDQFREGSVNHLTHDVINPVQEKVYEPNMHMNDVAVEVARVAEESP